MKIAVFCGASLPEETRIISAARELGRWIAQEGHTLVYGGSNLGLMGVVSGAAMEAGGKVVAVIPTLFSEEVIKSQLVTELVRVGSMAERKERIIAMCDLFIALPGGIGTIDEVSEVMVFNQLNTTMGKVRNGSMSKKPMLLLNLDGYYDGFLAQMQQCYHAGLLRSDCGLVACPTIDDLLCHIC